VKKRFAAKAAYIVLLLILLLPLSSAKVSAAKLNVTMIWTIRSDIILDESTVAVFIPSNSSNQKIISMNFSDPYELITEKNALKARFNIEGVRAKQITGNFLIETDYINRTKTDSWDDRYLNESKNVVINDEVRTLAAMFNETFPNNIIKMNEWVHDNIRYNLSYTDITVNDIVDTTQTSEWVLKNRVGVCDELSNLFIALARASGIPARVIVGSVFKDNQWIPHAWAEVYIPRYGWIEVDPTWNEFLNLNALRFRTGTGADISEVVDKINATVKKNGDLKFQSDVKIDILNTDEGDKLSIDINFPPQFPTSEYQPVMIKTRNMAAAPLYITSSLVPPIEVECRNCTTKMFLEPNEEYTKEFNLQLPTLNQNTRYTFPVLVVTEFGRKNASFERLIIPEPSLEEKYQSIGDLPLSFKWFIGLFMIGAVALVIIVILAKV